MKLRICFEINGLGVNETGDPSPVGLCVAFDVGCGTGLPSYQKLIQSVKKERVLRMVGLDGLVRPEDMNFITPEEYDQDYGDDGEDSL